MDNGYIQSPEELPAMIGQCRKDYVTVTGVNHSIGLQCDEVGYPQPVPDSSARHGLYGGARNLPGFRGHRHSH